ncbi:hypothetical protein [Mesorhizobium waimense]|uniref:hypothetical protein n=1 Tax=Mesorhizobium waimense TaxID=1300307 RepID=UPI0011C4956E|nr:hypothetical protein [Mesorhizobium waimense]
MSGQPAPRAYLAQLLPLELRGKLDAAGGPTFLSSRTIEICLVSGYELAPPALQGILEHLIAAGNANVARFSDRLTNPPPAAAHPLDAIVLSNRLPFADRAPLRAILRDMSVMQSPTPILAIGGEVESGRSHSAELVSHYCYSQQDAVFCKFALTPTNAAESGPKEIAVDLVIQLGGTAAEVPPPPQTSNKEAWYKELANWVIGNANKSENGINRRAWVVLDGFERGILREDTFQFLVELQRLFTLGVTARRHRLIFCGFPEELVLKVGASAKKYITMPLTRDHVVEVVEMIVAAQPAIPQEDRAIVMTETLKLVLDNQVPPFKALTIVGERLRSAIERAGI